MPRRAAPQSPDEPRRVPETGNVYLDTLARNAKPFMRFGMRLAEKLHIPNVFGVGGERDLKGKERAALAALGYQKSGSNKWRNAATGDVIKSRKKAIRTARQYIRGGGTVAGGPPPPPPPAPAPAPYPYPIQGNEPWRPPSGGDWDYERAWAEMGIEGLDYQDYWGWYPPPAQGFVGAPGEWVPPAATAAAADVLGMILRGAVGILGVFWPNSTADDDEVWTEPVREDDYQGSPWGETEVEQEPVRLDDYMELPLPDESPAPYETPLEVPEVWAEPLPDPLDVPLEVPEIYVPRMPEPFPGVPTAAPAPTWDPWSLLPEIGPELFAPRADGRRRRRPVREPQPPPLADPLTYAQPYAVPLRADPCNCAAEKPRKRKKGCTNPIVRKRKTRRGAVTYITTTRRQQCRA